MSEIIGKWLTFQSGTVETVFAAAFWLFCWAAFASWVTDYCLSIE